MCRLAGLISTGSISERLTISGVLFTPVDQQIVYPGMLVHSLEESMKRQLHLQIGYTSSLKLWTWFDEVALVPSWETRREEAHREFRTLCSSDCSIRESSYDSEGG